MRANAPSDDNVVQQVWTPADNDDSVRLNTRPADDGGSVRLNTRPADRISRKYVEQEEDLRRMERWQREQERQLQVSHGAARQTPSNVRVDTATNCDF